jgi:hypothetical protein
MKRFFIFIFLFFSLDGFSFGQDVNLPAACRKILNEKHRGWRFAKILPEIQKHLRETVSSDDARGDLIAGDWNGDGRRDYAALIEHGTLYSSDGNPVLTNDGKMLKRNVAVAFVQSGKSYEYFLLDDYGDYLLTEKKDTPLYDYSTKSRVRFKTDTIFAGIWEKAGRSFVWHKNKFIYFQTSD